MSAIAVSPTSPRRAPPWAARRIGFAIDHDPFPNRVMSFERHVDQRLIDDHHFQRSGCVVFIEGSAAKKINPERLKIIALHYFIVGCGLLAWIGRRRAFGRE